MSRAPKQYTETMFDPPADGPRKGRFVVPGLAVLAALGGTAAVMLSSGPDAPAPDPVRDAAVSADQPGDPSAIAADAPVYTLGEGADGDWRRGQQTRYVMEGSDSLPALTIDATRVVSGRYTYPGDLTIEGTITQPYVEFTAGGNITVTGSVAADHVTLTALEQPGHNHHPEFRNIHSDNYYIYHWNREFPRGDIAVGGHVTGHQIGITAGTIAIAGNAHGAVTLSASGGEIAGVYLCEQYYGKYQSTSLVYDERIPADEFYFDQRRPIEMTRKVVTIGGEAGADVIRQSTTDWSRQRDEALGIVRPPSPLPPHLRRYGEYAGPAPDPCRP